MDYRHFEAHDFLADEFFVEWVLETNGETAHFWENWLKAHPEKRTEVARAKELIKSIQYKKKDKLSEVEYSLIFEKALRANEKQNRKLIHWIPKYTYRVAASIILVISTLFLINNSLDQTKPTPEQVVTSTRFGQRKTFRLSDGTVITLNAGSSLEYPHQFTGKSRQVKLTGEAFFEVARDTAKPFIIQTNELSTKVLGTSFNVRAYPEEEDISVAVMTGKVQINNRLGNEEILLPRDMGVFNKVSNSINKHKYDREIAAWTEGILILEDETLPVIFNKLEKWYGVRFEYDEGMKLEGRYSGRYQNKSLELVLEGISYTSNFKYMINNKKVLIYE